MRGDGPYAGSQELARDLEGEVDRALLRSGEAEGEGGATLGAARVVSPAEIRAALRQTISQGPAIVVLEVRRPGEGAVRARVPQMLWAALLETLARDEQHSSTRQEAKGASGSFPVRGQAEAASSVERERPDLDDLLRRLIGAQATFVQTWEAFGDEPRPHTYLALTRALQGLWSALRALDGALADLGSSYGEGECSTS